MPALIVFLVVLFLHRRVIANFFKTKRWKRSKSFLFVLLALVMIFFLHLDVLKYEFAEIFHTNATETTSEKDID